MPPASITSASSRRIVSHASPIAWAPVAQADTVAKFGPSIPNAIATWPEPTFAMPIGMKNGLIRSGAALGHQEDVVEERRDPAEPGPEDDPGPLGELARRSGRAGRPGRAPARDHQPELDVAVRPPHLLAVEDGAGSKSRTSAAIFESTATGRTLDRPDARLPGEQAAHVEATSLPSADRAPMPGHDDAPRPLPLRRSSHQLPGADGRRAVDVAGQAARGDRVRDRREDVVTRCGGSRRRPRSRPRRRRRSVERPTSRAPTRRSGRRRRRSRPCRR